MSAFRTVQGCPVNQWIAPYIAIVVNDAHAFVTSIYRGADAANVLHKHGKHSQAELYDGYRRGLPGYLPANPPGFSTHELRSDGVAYRVSRGARLAWWQEGFDVDNQYVEAVVREARKHGWRLFRPYGGGSEYHHLNFERRPWPTPSTLVRIWRLRNTLPRS